MLYAASMTGQKLEMGTNQPLQNTSVQLKRSLGLLYHSGSFASDPSKNNSIYQSKISPGFTYLGAVYGYQYKPSRSWQFIFNINTQRDLDKKPRMGDNIRIDTTIHTSDVWLFFFPLIDERAPTKSQFESIRYFTRGGFQFQINHRKEFMQNNFHTFLQVGVTYEQLYLYKSKYTFFGEIKDIGGTSTIGFPFFFGSSDIYHVKGTSYYSEKKITKELFSFALASGLNFKLKRHFYLDFGGNLKINFSTSRFTEVPYRFINANLFATIGKYF